MRRYTYATTALVALAASGFAAGLTACDEPHTPSTPDTSVEVSQELPGAEVTEDVAEDVAADVAAELPPEDVQPELGPDTPGDGEVSQPEVDADGDADGGLDAELPPMPCDPPLAFEVEETSVLPYRLAVLKVTGGTGDYAFELTTDGSGALVNELSGAYVAGGVSGTADIVTVTDGGCIGSAEATLNVVAEMEVTPLEPVLPPGATMPFQVSGGSGEITYEVLVGTSGGSVTPSGVYTAGTEDGVDNVQITDTVTGQSTVVTVLVFEGATPVGAPQMLLIAQGQTQTVKIVNGSGLYTMAPANTDTVAVSADGLLVAGTPGETTVLVTDDATGLTTTLDVVVAPYQTVANERMGDGTGWASIATGDITGDGIPDAVMGVEEADVEAWDSGAVYVYEGLAGGGLNPEPIQVLSVNNRRSWFGRKVALADYNNDGALDLFVSSPFADVGFSDNGAVYVHDGMGADGFATEPSYTFFGDSNSDYFGMGFAVCDFNNDGLVDLAVGAQRNENNQMDPVPSDQGSIFIFMARAEGFLASPDATIFGVVPSEDATSIGPQANVMYFGTEMATGDHNGDGLCDLAVYGERYRSVGVSGNRDYDGAVFVFGGVAATDSFIGGVTATPIRAMRGDEETSWGSRFGRKLALGDVTGDGTDDILIGQYNHRNGSTLGVGAARLFLADGHSFPGEGELPLWESATEADWSLIGDNSYDYYGWDVAIVDANGQGPLDVVSSNVLGETPEGESGAGYLSIHYGVEGEAPSLTPSLTLSGQLTGSPRFGAAIASLGDMDGDGLADFMVQASHDDTLGYEVGRPYYVSSSVGTEGTEVVGLDMPGEAAGLRFGWSGAVVGDVTGNGYPDMAVGAYYGDVVGEGLNSGRVILYQGHAQGFDVDPAGEFTSFAAYSSGDYYGVDVTGLGDFDGDGVDDIAIAAQYEDRPTNLPGSYSQDGVCGSGARNNSGATAIFSGGATVTEGEPAFLIYGPGSNDYVESVAGGFDINGDGRNDLAFSSRYNEPDTGGITNSGGFTVVTGRDRLSPTAATVVCEPDYMFRSYETNAYLGYSIAPLGDVNGDGCDELAIGGYGYDFSAFGGSSNKGGTYILFGWGAGCTQSEPKMIALAPFDSGGAQSGFSLAGGHPVDMVDDIPDLVVGGYVLSQNGVTAGGVWLVPGSYIASLEPQAEALQEGQSPSQVHPLTPPSATSTQRVGGTVNSEQFGRSVALIPGVGPMGRALVAVGGPGGHLGGAELSGGVTVFQAASGGGLDPIPVATFGGEPARPGGRLGNRVRAGALGNGNGAALLVGGFYGSSFGLDQGSMYVIKFD